MNFKIVKAKKFGEKNWHFLLKLLLVFAEFDHNIGF
jgi:hypothetical protein